MKLNNEQVIKALLDYVIGTYSENDKLNSVKSKDNLEFLLFQDFSTELIDNEIVQKYLNGIIDYILA